MRIKNTLLAAWVAILHMLFMHSANAADTQKTIILATQNWPPYQVETPMGLSGIATDKISCAMSKLGKPYEYKVYPWRRAQKEVKLGLADAFFSASPNEERSKYATISEKVADQKWNWYLLKENLLDPKDPNFKVVAKAGALIGSNTQTWLLKNGYQAYTNSIDLQEVFLFLKNKKIDAVLSTDKAAESAIKANGGSLDDYNVYTLKSNILGVYWSKEFLKRNPGFLEQFNVALKGCE